MKTIEKEQIQASHWSGLGRAMLIRILANINHPLLTGDWLRNNWTPDWRLDTILTLVQNTNITNQKNGETGRIPLQSDCRATFLQQLQSRWQQVAHGQEWVHTAGTPAVSDI